MLFDRIDKAGRRHPWHDGQGKVARDAFSRLSQADQQRVVKFLNSL